MATAAMPIGNPAGVNQANPALKSSSLAGATVPSASPVPGGSTPSPSNPYIMTSGGGAPGGTTGSNVPSTSPAPVNQQQDDLTKQWKDIYGKGTGGEMATMFSGMAGTESDIFKQLQASMDPTFAKQKAGLTQTLGAAGLSPNSTVESLGLADLGAQQSATMAGLNAKLMEQNQQNQLGLVQSAQGASAAEVASSGWDVFGQVVGDVGSLVGDVMGVGGAVGGLGNLFGKGGKTPSVPTAPSGAGANTMGGF